jgi:hypothetical protein
MRLSKPGWQHHGIESLRTDNRHRATGVFPEGCPARLANLTSSQPGGVSDMTDQNGQTADQTTAPTGQPTGQTANRTDQTITVPEAADLLGISPDAVLKRIRRGLLVATKDPRRQWQVHLPISPDNRTDSQPDRQTEPAGQTDNRTSTRTAPEKHHAPHPSPSLAALHAENALLKEQLVDAQAEAARWRHESEDWKAQVVTALRLVDQQQQLSLPAAMREMPPALPEKKPGFFARLFARK